MLILITGASSGFGKLTVPLLLRKGHTVLAGVRGGEARMRELFPQEIDQHSGRLIACDLDLKVPESLNQAARLIEERFGGRLDVLVNNAGYGLIGAPEDQSEAQIRDQMEVNFLGTVFLSRALLPAIRQAKGRILNLSSIAGMAGFPFYASYCASKYALEGFMECLMYDLKPFGVQVAMIEPGGFKTGFVTARKLGEKSQDPSSPYFQRTQGFLRIFERTSENRLGDPQDVARLIAKLCMTKRLRFRNWIGRDACVIRLMRSFVPEWLRFGLVARAFEWTLRREL